MRKILIIVVMVFILAGCSSDKKSDWIKPGDTFTFEGDDYKYNNAYSNEDNSKIYLDITPVSDLGRNDLVTAVGPIPKKAYAIDSHEEEIYSPETWREDGHLQLNITGTKTIYGVVYEDKDGTKFFFELYEDN